MCMYTRTQNYRPAGTCSAHSSILENSWPVDILKNANSITTESPELWKLSICRIFKGITTVHTCWLDCGLDRREASWRGSGVPSGNTFTWHLQVVVARLLLAVATTSPVSASAQSVSRSVHVPYWSLSVGKGQDTYHKKQYITYMITLVTKSMRVQYTDTWPTTSQTPDFQDKILVQQLLDIHPVKSWDQKDPG